MTKTFIRFSHPSRKEVLLSQGFNWAAFIFGPFWAAMKRQWILAILLAIPFVPINMLENYAEKVKSPPLLVLEIVIVLAYMYVCGRYGNMWIQSCLIGKGYTVTDNGAS